MGSGVGRERRGIKPCVVVSDPDITCDQRFPLVGVVPVALSGACSMKQRANGGVFALIDHLRSVDKRRIWRKFGQMTAGEIAAINEGSAVFLGLGDRPADARPL